MITEATTARLIDGQLLADQVLAKLPRRPGLGTISVGNDLPLQYLNSKQRVAAMQTGIKLYQRQLPATAAKARLVSLIHQYNDDETIDAITVQLSPLAHFNLNYFATALRPDKDINGLHPVNVKTMIAGRQAMPMPPLLKAIDTVLKAADLTLKGKRAVIVIRNEPFREPLTWMLMHQGMAAEWVRPDDPKLAQKTSIADVLISFCSRPNAITAVMVKPGAIVIDGGMSWVGPEQWAGDVAPDVEQVASWLTPVPNGIWPLAIAMLMQNTVQLSQRRQRASQ
ncbi:MAG: hypothetical protein A2951_03115 [Candidatus Buchananbacteria bacterium RIFCSPLOWO2_01_FULL_56_15]|uniref:Methenyltetrahydrofolate cyclohydrolase n=2 Tax=Candidatus Buchananiibacteriota TaxID=1817903 RepID=A0A1G1YI28_9BACT|nr:MAG: hypothetical protein A3J59_04595 [Candidatus Buchananbacteria bacterium RIFCSPHIGHO2_02_FULL_56_16]OGY55322.1 MAG: hypothetical protein A2951_03115 [Candidatus Buchananbacteria bacterium RIFCSPLOWO2_01_FULL_56_15]